MSLRSAYAHLRNMTIVPSAVTDGPADLSRVEKYNLVNNQQFRGNYLLRLKLATTAKENNRAIEMQCSSPARSDAGRYSRNRIELEIEVALVQTFELAPNVTSANADTFSIFEYYLIAHAVLVPPLALESMDLVSIIIHNRLHCVERCKWPLRATPRAASLMQPAFLSAMAATAACRDA